VDVGWGQVLPFFESKQLVLMVEALALLYDLGGASIRMASLAYALEFASFWWERPLSNPGLGVV
jgi:hypothetical protein